MDRRKTEDLDIAEVVTGVEQRIRELQKRLETPVSNRAVDELEAELQKYFARESAAEIRDLRRRVVDGVVDKIMRAWEKSHDDIGLEEQIVDRLVERIHERLAVKVTSGSRSRES